MIFSKLFKSHKLFIITNDELVFTASIHAGISRLLFPKKCKPQSYLDTREARCNARDVNKSGLGTVEGINDDVCIPTPRQLSVLPRQWPCAWCHGPDGVPADPWAQESA